VILQGLLFSKGHIVGVVKSHDGVLLNNVTVRLSGSRKQATITNREGEYEFRNLPNGKYNLIFTLKQYNVREKYCVIDGGIIFRKDIKNIDVTLSKTTKASGNNTFSKKKNKTPPEDVVLLAFLVVFTFFLYVLLKREDISKSESSKIDDESEEPTLRHAPLSKYSLQKNNSNKQEVKDTIIEPLNDTTQSSNEISRNSKVSQKNKEEIIKLLKTNNLSLEEIADITSISPYILRAYKGHITRGTYDDIQKTNKDSANIKHKTVIPIINDNASMRQIYIEKSDYADAFKTSQIKNYNTIQKLAIEFGEKNDINWSKLERGAAIIKEKQLLYQFIFSYGEMHKHKLSEGFSMLPWNEIANSKVNCIDWGCGQALATVALCDYLQKKNYKIFIDNLLLIEPSVLALERGLLHISSQNIIKKVIPINKDLNSILIDDITFENKNHTIHLFSNILDIPDYNIKKLSQKLKKVQKGRNYFLCVSPSIDDLRNQRINSFFRYLRNDSTIVYSERHNQLLNNIWRCKINYCNKCTLNYPSCGKKPWTRYEKVFSNYYS